VGAGDAFSAAFCHGISCAWPALQIADFANRVGAVVASRPEAVSNWTIADCHALL
jgi:fructokinase